MPLMYNDNALYNGYRGFNEGCGSVHIVYYCMDFI